MPSYCIVCKKESLPVDCRSFHRFPNDEQLRNQWMNALGILCVKKHTKICSDHFHTHDFHAIAPGLTKHRRLLATAVPHLDTETILPDITISTNIADPIAINGQNSFSILKRDENENENDNTSEDGIKKEIENEITIEIEQESENEIEDEIENENEITIFEEKVPMPSQCEEDTRPLHENIIRMKQRLDVSHIPSTKKYRFYDGFQPMHLSRQDFTSDDAWTRFLKYATIKQRQIEVWRKKHRRFQLKLQSLT